MCIDHIDDGQAIVRKFEQGGSESRKLELYPDVNSIELAQQMFKAASDTKTAAAAAQ